MKRRQIILTCINMLLIFLFTYTGVSKLYDRSLFQFQLSTFPLVKNFSMIISWSVPFIELATAGLLVIPSMKLIGLYNSLSILSLFTIYIFVIASSYKKLPCSCGGVIANLSWTQHIFFNLFFIGLSATAIFLGRKQEFQQLK